MGRCHSPLRRRRPHLRGVQFPREPTPPRAGSSPVQRQAALTQRSRCRSRRHGGALAACARRRTQVASTTSTHTNKAISVTPTAPYPQAARNRVPSGLGGFGNAVAVADSAGGRGRSHGKAFSSHVCPPLTPHLSHGWRWRRRSVSTATAATRRPWWRKAAGSHQHVHHTSHLPSGRGKRPVGGILAMHRSPLRRPPRHFTRAHTNTHKW